jgi:NADH-quinone oxidoreductase chain I
MAFGTGIMAGLLRVLAIGLRKPVTYMYPESPRPVAERFRGMVGMRRDEVTGELSCVGCGLCETACPNDVIRIDTSETEGGTRWVERYQFDLGRCIFCYLCVEACPVDALQMTRAYHLSTHDRADLILTAPDMMRMTENPDQPLFEHLWRD